MGSFLQFFSLSLGLNNTYFSKPKQIGFFLHLVCPYEVVVWASLLAQGLIDASRNLIRGATIHGKGRLRTSLKRVRVEGFSSTGGRDRAWIEVKVHRGWTKLCYLTVISTSSIFSVFFLNPSLFSFVSIDMHLKAKAQSLERFWAEGVDQRMGSYCSAREGSLQRQWGHPKKVL